MQILGKAIRRALMLGLAALTATVHGDEPPLDVVARAIEHHGGETYRASETQLDVCSKSGCFRVVARVDGGNFEYTVSGRAGGGQRASGGRREVRWSNDALEVRVDGEPQAVAAGDEQRFRDWAMARVYFCFEPGSSTDAGDEYMYWFDPETARLELFAYSYDSGGGGIRFRRAIDHRRIGGLLFFDQENLGVDGPGLSVDAIDPDYVRREMRHVSTVRLQGIEVRPLH